MQLKHITPQLFETRSFIAENGCWLWLGYQQSGGYGQMYVERKRKLAHRMSWQTYRGPIPDKLLVLHECDTPACVNPNHLFLGTYSDNMRDCVNKKRAHFQQPGVDFWFTRKSRIKKLTDDNVREIRCSIAPLAVLAKRFGVSMSCVSTTRRGKRKQLVV